MPDELAAYVLKISEKFQYGAFLFRLDSDALESVDPATLQSVPKGTQRMFLHPLKPVRKVVTLDDAAPRKWGWIDIRTGALADSLAPGGLVLTMTLIEGESSPQASNQPPQVINWLKRRIQDDVTFGVIGRADATHPGTRYPGIGYTKGAESLRKTGCVWKSELTHRSQFEPIET
jgi:hypothetical protein